MSTQDRTHDLIIIGAGPAGMSAALEAHALGLDVIVLNEGGTPGGRIYHGLERLNAKYHEDVEKLGSDYRKGLELIDAFNQSGVSIKINAAVFRLDPDGTVWFSWNNTAQTLDARSVLIATGAMERPVPVPGWTLPGVMTAGGAQMLLKGDGLIPSGPVVLAGCGPLLILTTCQLLDMGAEIRAVVDTVRPSDYVASLLHMPRALQDFETLTKGIGMLRKLRQSGVECISGANTLAVTGEDHATGLLVNGRTIPAETVLLHNGVVPECNLTRQVGCDHEWDKVQRCWKPVSDEWGASSLDNIYVAGDGGGIAGALTARCSGRLSALSIALQLGKIDRAYRESRAKIWKMKMRRHMAARPFLDRLFRPRDFLLAPPDAETVVCRCEEVSVAEIRDAGALGCPGPNQLKSFTRAGMGPCQGRLCGLTVSEIMARQINVSPAEFGYFSIRPPVKPVTLAQLAQLDME